MLAVLDENQEEIVVGTSFDPATGDLIIQAWEKKNAGA